MAEDEQVSETGRRMTEALLVVAISDGAQGFVDAADAAIDKNNVRGGFLDLIQEFGGLLKEGEREHIAWITKWVNN